MQVKEPYGNFDMVTLQPGVYEVHLPIILEEGLSVYKERKKKWNILTNC